MEGTAGKIKCAAESNICGPYDKLLTNDLNKLSRMIGKWITISWQWKGKWKLVCPKVLSNKELLQIIMEDTNKL